MQFLFFTLSAKTIWLAIGFLGQAMFSARFLLQWLASERVKESIIPKAFWYFSLLGGTTLFLYALHLKDPVFILGQAAGIFIYLRNLYFVNSFRKKRLLEDEAAKASGNFNA